MKPIISQKLNRGFSLIELLVAMSLFTVVMITAVGCLLVMVDANGRAQNMQQIMTNASFALDSIVREVRTGSYYYCSDQADSEPDENDVRDCEGGDTFLSFVEGGESITDGQGDRRIAFRFNSGASNIERRVEGGDWLPITSNEVVIEDAYFVVTGTALAPDGDEVQPLVTIFIKGFAGQLESERSSFSLQTTVSKRIIDL